MQFQAPNRIERCWNARILKTFGLAMPRGLGCGTPFPHASVRLENPHYRAWMATRQRARLVGAVMRVWLNRLRIVSGRSITWPSSRSSEKRVAQLASCSAAWRRAWRGRRTFDDTSAANLAYGRGVGVDLGTTTNEVTTKSTLEVAVPRAVPTAAKATNDKHHNAIQAAFIRRTAHAIERLAAQADEATLVEAMAAPTDVGTLARVLVDVGAIGSAVAEIDADAVDLAAEIQHRGDIIRRAGGTLSADDVGKLLNISRQAVDKRRRSNRLLALRQGGDWLYPRAQFHAHETIPGLADVIRDCAESGPWVTLEFLVTEDDVLSGLSPRAALLKGGELRARVATLLRGQSRGEGFA